MTQQLVRQIRRLLPFLWPSALVTALYLRFANIGFNPSDEGTLQAQTWKILHGEVPHRDFIFARPLASAVLHTVDFALPLPLVLSERLVGIIVYVGYSFLFARLIFDKPVRQWTVTLSLGAIICVALNIHTVLLTTWYTTDGLLFSAAGMVVLTSKAAGARHRDLIGLMLLGLAPLMKQSFFLAPILGVLAVSLRSSRTERRRALTFGLIAVLIPSCIYVAIVSGFGGLEPMVHQITHATPVFGRSFILVFTLPAVRGNFVALFLFGAALLAFTVKKQRSLLDLPVRLGFTALLLVVPLTSRFSLGGVWAFFLWWMAVLVVAREFLNTGRLDWVGVFVIAAGWMASLSLGYAGPHLASGACFLYALHRTWSGFPSPPVLSPESWRALGLTASVIAAIITCSVFVGAREAHPQEDVSRSELTAHLNLVSPEFGSVVTNPVTFQYLSEMSRCIRSYPARWVAVLPDNAAIYPIFRVRNPFPLDWMFPEEVSGYETRMLMTAKKLDKEGGYLVLFQTFSALDLPRMSAIFPATTSSIPFFYGSDLGRRILDQLHGVRVACGSFVGEYNPSS